MKKILLAIGFFIALTTEAQVVNKFRDSSVFFKGVRFDSTLVFKGLKSGSTADTNVVVISSTGKASKVSKSAFLGDLPIYSISDSNTVINYDVLNSQNTPPVSPSTGDVYLVGTVPTGAWVGHAKDIAEWNGSSWDFTDGIQGDFLYNATTALTYIFRSGNWVQTTGIPALNNGNTISSGLKVGTNNARSLTFETNNANRGRFDSVGRFYVYNLPASSTGDTFVTQVNSLGEFTKQGKSTFLSGISGGGGGSTDSIYLFRTYAQLRTEMLAHALIGGASYQLTDFQNIYDQSATDLTKTATGETLILTAVSDSSFSPIVYSLEYPTDIIHYDITIDTTYVNGAPAKGKITYRENENGIKTPFDFRTVLMYNDFDFTESLYFDLSKNISDVELSGNPKLLKSFADVEFPFCVITGNVNNVKGLTTLGSLIDGDVVNVSNAIINGSYIKGISLSTGVKIYGATFGGNITQMINVDVTECTITGKSDYCTTGTWTNSTFGEQVNKCIGTNFSNSTIGGRVDRIINCAILTDTIIDRLYWCQDVAMFHTYVNGYAQGLNQLTLTSVHSDCNVKHIQGVSMFDSKSGFVGCTITGTSAASVFGHIKVECLVQGKTIDQATYPELFNETYTKTIYKKPNGTIWYTWLDNSNVAQFTEIL